MFRHKKLNAPVISEPYITSPMKPYNYNPKIFGRNGEFYDHGQTVTVNVTVNEHDDDIAECLSGCFRACIGASKAAAKG